MPFHGSMAADRLTPACMHSLISLPMLMPVQRSSTPWRRTDLFSCASKQQGSSSSRSCSMMSSSRASRAWTVQRPSSAARQGRQLVHASAAAAARTEAEPHVQLATAKLPPNVDVGAFVTKMYQWAATLTSSGRNMPLALPLRTDRTDEGIMMQLLRVVNNRAVSVGDIAVVVEPVPDVGNVLFVRFYEGEGAKSAYKYSGGLQQLMEQLIDVPQIVNSMPAAIKTAIMQSRE